MIIKQSHYLALKNYILVLTYIEYLYLRIYMWMHYNLGIENHQSRFIVDHKLMEHHQKKEDLERKLNRISSFVLIKSCAPNSNTAKHSSYSCFFIVDDAILQDNISCNISGVVIITETNKNLLEQDFLGNRVNNTKL